MDMMHISMLSVLIPTGLCVAIFGRLPVALKVLSVIVFSTFLMQVVAYIFFLKSINNLPLFHAFTFIEFSCISIMYYYIFESDKSLKRFVGVLVICFLFFSIINLVCWESIYMFNSNQRAVEFSLVMLYFLIFFRKVLNGSLELPSLKHPYFILTFGYFIYFAGTIFLFLNANQFIELGIVNYWMIHGILSIFLNIIYFIVLWKGSKQ